MSEEKKKEDVREKKRVFAQTSISENAQNYTTSMIEYSADQVNDLLTNPYKNALELQTISVWLYHNNGIYNRIINNFAGMNCYDLYLYPSTISRFVKDSKKKTASEKLLKGYVDIAKIFEKYSYKSNFRKIGTNLLIQGEVFLYTVEDSSGTIEKELYPDMCKISRVVNDGLYKYSINMGKLSDEKKRSMMPKPIQDLYEQHQAGTIPPEQYTESNYVLVDDPEAICLSLNTTVSTRGIPPLCYLFPSLIRYMNEEIEELQESRANNLKLIHMKYQVDDEGEPILDEADLKKMHAQAKANLPTGVAINTNPLEVTAHTLQRTGNVNASNRQTLTELVYNNAGVNSEIFNGNQSNNQAIITGVISDQIYCDTLNDIFENYAKYKVKTKKANPLWLPRFIRNTKYNERELITEAISCCAVGLSRLKLLATQHYSPLEGLATLDFETENMVDELFVPLATAYTQSANENEEGGRPKASEESGNTKGVSDNKDSTNK